MKQKMREFINTHKKQIVFSTGVVIIGGAIGYVVLNQKPKVCKRILTDYGDLPIPEYNENYGCVLKFWQEHGYKKAIVEYDLSELGELKNVFEGVEGIRPHQMVTLVMEFSDEINELLV
jgi:hypothetical protein